MAGATPTLKAARNVRRAVDATINLVPFIDLLSCCIAFLLITAAWTQFQRITASPPHAELGGDAPPAAPAPILTLTKDGYMFESTSTLKIANTDQEHTLAEVLVTARRERSEDAGLIIRAVDGVPYARVAHAMDVASGAGWAALELDGAASD